MSKSAEKKKNKELAKLQTGDWQGIKNKPHCPLFTQDEYECHDYGIMWKHVAVRYEDKQTGKSFITEAECRLYYEEQKHKR